MGFRKENGRRAIYWLIIVAVSASIVGYLCYIDEREDTHTPGVNSTDSIQTMVMVFTFYTLVVASVIDGIGYLILERYINRPSKR